jgi:hypothetical protein
MEENPSDGTPWLGLLMIRADLHRHGLASEVFAGLARELRRNGLKQVRTAHPANCDGALLSPSQFEVAKPAAVKSVDKCSRGLGIGETT